MSGSHNHDDGMRAGFVEGRPRRVLAGYGASRYGNAPPVADAPVEANAGNAPTLVDAPAEAVAGNAPALGDTPAEAVAGNAPAEANAPDPANATTCPAPNVLRGAGVHACLCSA